MIENIDEIIEKGYQLESSEAIAYFKELEKDNSKIIDYKLIRIGYELRMYPENNTSNEEELKKLFDKNPLYSNWIAHLLAIIAEYSGNDNKNDKYLYKAFMINHVPQNGTLFIQHALDTETNLPKALEIAKILCDEDDEQDSSFMAYLGLIYIFMGNFAKAKNIIDKMALIHPLDPLTTFINVCYLEKMPEKDYKTIIDALSEAIRKYPDFLQFKNHLIHNLVDNKDYILAEKLIDELEPNKMTANYVKLDLAYKLGLKNAYNEIFNEIISTSNDDKAYQSMAQEIDIHYDFIEKTDEELIQLFIDYFLTSSNSMRLEMMLTVGLSFIHYDIGIKLIYPVLKDYAVKSGSELAYLRLAELCLHMGESYADKVNYLKQIKGESSDIITDQIVYNAIISDKDNQFRQLIDLYNHRNLNIRDSYWEAKTLFLLRTYGIQIDGYAKNDSNTSDYNIFLNKFSTDKEPCDLTLFGRHFELIYNNKKTAYEMYETAYNFYLEDKNINKCTCPVAYYAYALYLGFSGKKRKKEAIKIVNDEYLKYKLHPYHLSGPFILFMSYLYLKKELNISKEEILNLLYLDENFRVTDASRYEMINRIKENKEFDTLAINEKDSGLAKEYFKKNSKKKDFVPFMVNN